MAKPRKQKLKVFRTPIGFHDAYLAAPSRKAALEIWGAGTDLFQAGIATEVKDGGEAAEAALKTPGEVVRVKRTAEIRDFPPRRSAGSGRKGKKDSPSTSSGRAASKTKRAEKPKPQSKPKPRPSRAALDRAESKLAALEKRQAAERAELDEEEAKLAKRRGMLEEKQRKAMERAEAKRDAAEKAYRRAFAEWAG